MKEIIHEKLWSYKTVKIHIVPWYNLYGWGMSQYLPSGGFKWLKNVDNFHVNLIGENSSIYILEVDLGYPEELHVLHNVLHNPLAREKPRVTYDILSGYCKKLQTNIE